MNFIRSVFSAAHYCFLYWVTCWLWSAFLDGSVARLTPAPTDLQTGSRHPNKALHWTPYGWARSLLRLQSERLVVRRFGPYFFRGEYGRT
jgi:hypothetical protein